MRRPGAASPSAISIQEDEIPIAIMAGRMKKFSEITSSIPEVMDSSTLNFKANFKFSRFFLKGGTHCKNWQLTKAYSTHPSGVCYKPLSISSVCENFRAQHPLGAEI